MNGGRGEANAAVNKAAGKNQPVTQQIALSVKGTKVDCAINGKTVASYLEAVEAPSLYRVHEEPDVLQVAKFEEFISGFGLSLGNRLLQEIAGVPAEEWERRRAEPRPAIPQSQTPWQELHRELVGQLSDGGCIERALRYQDIDRSRGLPRHSH